MAAIQRRDHHVAGEDGIRLFVREVRPRGAARGLPVLLLHGARVPGVASFDLTVPGGSLAADLAAAGHPVYALDARGYGGSTRPPAMAEPPDGRPPLVRSSEVVHDLAAAVEWVCQRLGAPGVALLGWATGGHWAGHYATLHPRRVRALIFDNTLYGGTVGHPSLGPGTDMEDPAHPGRFNAAAYGAYRLNTAASLLPGWDRSIPLDDKAAWRDPGVADAYVAAALASDPAGAALTPPAFRAPSGALEDSFYLACGRQLWDASFVLAPTLVLRSERDFWSRPEDPVRLIEHLVHAPVARAVTLPDATHFVHLDRPERGRDRFLAEVLAFLADAAG
ncbi:MAG TPA: alpha/beta fold hydrolase [Thermomicrobiales bacterium]|nr:alpha/beta fold hydrolase [Thermomicrobiales bacterium]